MKNKCSRISETICAYATALFGRFTWNPPPWLMACYRKAASLSRLVWGLIISVIVLLVMAFYWYAHLPVPVYTTANITVPEITPLGEKLVPDNLTINFTKQFVRQSVAPLSEVNKEVVAGARLTPSLPGKWFWRSDSQLQFVPAADWPAGQTYAIDFDKNIFSPHATVHPLSYSFTTRPFQAALQTFTFYQDPIDPSLRQVIATVVFNYPVDPDSLAAKVHLQLQAIQGGHEDRQAETFPFTITYDNFKRTAYVRSGPLPLPSRERYLELTIDQGIKPVAGPMVTPSALKKSVLLPDATSYFKFSAISAQIVRNEQDKPQQLLTLESTIGVTQNVLNKNVHVYLLPEDYPATSNNGAIKQYHWQNPGEVNSTILALSTPVNLQTVPADREYATLHSYQVDLPTPRFMYVKIDKGMVGFGNYTLSRDYQAVLPVPAFPKEIGFVHPGSVLALDSEKKLSITVRGLPAVKFTLARILPDDVNQLVTQTGGSFKDPYFLNEHFNEQNISEIFSEVRSFNPAQLDQLQYTALDIGKYLATKKNAKGPTGLFLLTATGWDPDKKVPLDVTSERLILITDCGILTKDNQDGSHDVFLQSIIKGTPINNANIAVLGKNGLPIITRVTDTSGHVYFPNLNDFIEDREPTVYLATQGNDVAFMPFKNADRQLNYSRFDIGGLVSNDLEQNTLNAYLFSDRGIYRPGDLAHVGIIVKQAYGEPAPAGLPLEIRVIDPRGLTVQDQKITLGPIGFFTMDFKTEAQFPTGQYTAELFIVKDNRPSSLLGSTTFKVAEFLPDRLKIMAHLSKRATDGWISPEGLNANVDLMNLYGAPAAKHKIRARLLLTPQTVQFPDYPQYIFMDPLALSSLKNNKPPKVFTETLTETETNDQGHTTFNLKLDRFEKATYQLTFFAEGFESEGGRSVATQVSALVSPLPYFIGYKPDGDLKFIKQNSQRQVNFIAIDPTLKKQAVSPLKLILFSERPITTLVKKPDGTYHYQSAPQLTEVSDQSFSIVANGSSFPLVTDKIGDFVVVIQDAAQTELCRFRYSVVGTDKTALPMNAELTLKLDQTDYRPGQDIQMEITAPYVGSGYITLERDKVYAYQWFQTKTTHSLQKIKVPAGFLGGGYVNVAFVRDWNSPEIFLSPLSFSIAPFAMEHEDKKIHITLDTLDEVRPGAPLTIHYKTDRPGKIIIFAVDEGILQVTHYKAPDPLAFYFQKRALEVNTQQIMDLILPKFIASRELSQVGGDSGEGGLNQYLNPFKRKTDLPVVYWSGLIDTDDKVHDLTYFVPDYFNGTLQIMAVAVADKALGSANKTTRVRGDFVIDPNVPTFIAPHDEFEVTASIANNIKHSGAGLPVTIEVHATPELEIVGAPRQTININEDGAQTIKIKMRAKDHLGPAMITWVARAGQARSQITSTLSVRPPSMYRTTIVSGQGEQSKQLSLLRDLYLEKRQVEAVVSSSPLIFVMGLERYLENYPYGCTEQLVSKVFPLLAMMDRPGTLGNPQTLNDKIQTTIQLLAGRQLSSGAFSYWPALGSNQNNPFISVYAMHFLMEARSHGLVVPNDTYTNGINYLKELAATDVTNLDQARTQAYAIYILTRNEMVTTDYLTHLQIFLEQDKASQWHHDITAVLMAATYQLLKSDEDAERLLAAYQPAPSDDQTTGLYSPSIAEAEYLYLIAKHFPDRFAKLDPKLLSSLVSTLNSDEINTILSSYASLALAAFGEKYQTAGERPIDITEFFKNGEQKRAPATDSLYQNVLIDFGAHQIQFKGPPKQPYFYQLIESGFDKTPTNKTIQQHLEIDRQYRNPLGQTLTSVSLGDEIEVHIQFRALGDHDLNNIAIVDLLPGGFEVVPDSINRTNIDYADVREDRVVFFGVASQNISEITYKIKATNRGRYTVPPIFANAMYDPTVQAQGLPGEIQVN